MRSVKNIKHCHEIALRWKFVSSSLAIPYVGGRSYERVAIKSIYYSTSLLGNSNYFLYLFIKVRYIDTCQYNFN